MSQNFTTTTPRADSGNKMLLCDGPRINMRALEQALSNLTVFTGSTPLFTNYLQNQSDEDDSHTTVSSHNLSTTTGSNLKVVQNSSWLMDGELPNVILYSFVFFVAVLGNILVIVTLLANRRMRTVTSCFLLSLSVSDLLLAIFCMPITLTGRILKRFVFGTIMCKIMPLFMGMSVSVSTFTMLAISIERYYAICKPFRSRAWQTVSHAYKVIVGIWIVSLLINIPYFVLSNLNYIPLIDYGKCSLACRLVFPSPVARQAWYVFLLVTLFVIPGLMMTVAYVAVSCQIWKEFRVKSSRSEGEINEEEDLDPGDGLYINPRKSQRSFRSFRNSVKRFIVRNEEMSSLEDESKSCNTVKYPRGTGTNAKKKVQRKRERENNQRSRFASQSGASRPADRLVEKKKVVRMLIVIVILFFFCWTPLSIVNVWKAFDPYTAMEALDGIIEIIQLMSYISTCVNPIVYCFMNQRFRNGFLRAFLYCLPKRCSKSYSSQIGV